MKLKRLPQDFQVEELPVVTPQAGGRFTFYRLTKQGLGTPEAIEAIRRRWNLSQAQIAYGGMKDRHARTVQYLTITDGPNRALRQEHFELVPLGGLPFPYGPRHFRGNRFVIAIRDLSDAAAGAASAALASVQQTGLPNYFDDQRFGSVGESGEFLAESWLKGSHERALWLAIAERNAHDRPGQREEKTLLRELWGRWPEAKAALPKSHARSLVTYLIDHPTDFRGAFARLNRTFRSLAFSAYQSHLWNLWLGAILAELASPGQVFHMPFATAELPMPQELDESQARAFAAWQIPLPSARNELPAGEIAKPIGEILAARGLDWKALRIKHLKYLFFSKGARPARFVPEHATSSVEADDLYPGRKMLRMAFELGKGSYATILVKRITRVQLPVEAPDDLDPV